MQLLHGKFKDADGVVYHVPSFTEDVDGEDAIVRTARSIAHSKGVRVVRVWAVYLLEKVIV